MGLQSLLSEKWLSTSQQVSGLAGDRVSVVVLTSPNGVQGRLCPAVALGGSVASFGLTLAALMNKRGRLISSLGNGFQMPS